MDNYKKKAEYWKKAWLQSRVFIDMVKQEYPQVYKSIAEFLEN